MCRPGGLEALHPPFTLSQWLIGILCPVIAMAPFQFAQVAGLMALKRLSVDPWGEVRERALNTPTKLNALSSALHHAA